MRLSKISIVTAGLILAVAFQNCSRVAFDASPSAAGKVQGVGLEGDGEGDGDGDTLTTVDPVALCEQTRARTDLVAIAAGGVIENITSNLAFSGTQIARVAGNRGNHIIVGPVGGTGAIDLLTDQAGNLLICDLDVKLLSVFARGNITIVNGDVGDIDDMHGNLTIVGGQVTGAVTNSNGNITVR